jgi:aldehyde dehydrogenase (NAD+)
VAVNAGRDTRSRSWRTLVGGEALDAAAGATTDVRNPATGEVIAQVPRCTAADVDRAVEAARTALPSWRSAAPGVRADAVHALADAIRAHADELAHVESLSSGKLLREARADAEGTAQFFEFYGGLAPSVEGSTFGDRADQLAYTVYEPYGVTGHIIPWNYPLSTAARSIAPALATGNVVVAKPAEQTPMTCLALAQLATECGLPDGVFNVVLGLGAEAGAGLAAHPGVPRLTFTGSVTTGKAVLHLAADHLAHTTVELGGKSPVVVFADADVDKAIAGVSKGILTHAGQVCAAGTRLLVENGVHDDVVEGVRARLDAITPGGDDDATNLAPMVSAQQRDKVAAYIEKGVEEGARLLTRDEPAGNGAGHYLRPAMFDGVTPDMTIAQEEIFGPVLAVTSFDGIEQAAQIANGNAFGLMAGIWTRDITKALKLARSIQAGTVYVNDYYIGGVELPFGGYKDSGFGREKGRQALESFVQSKSVAIALGS